MKPSVIDKKMQVQESNTINKKIPRSNYLTAQI